MTRTHTRFFDSDLLTQIQHLSEQMSYEWDSRATYIDSETRESGNARIAVLLAAIVLCDEPVPFS